MCIIHTNFIRDFGAALFDTTGDFIDYVQIHSTNGTPLPPNHDYPGGITFSNSGMLTLQGSYHIGIYEIFPLTLFGI